MIPTPTPSGAPSPRPLSDVEITALVALANVEAVLMAGTNSERLFHNYAPAYADGTGMMPAGEALRTELHRRGINI